MKSNRLACTICILLSALSVSVGADTAASKPWNVLLITVDNLRPDHMSVYGYQKNTTPYLEKFAEESAVFDNAFSTSAWTAPGVVSMFTGYYPPVHAQHGRFSFYDEKMTAAFRILAAKGYEIRGQSIWGASHQGFGFQDALGDWPRRKLEDFVELRLENPAPFFAWAHLTDVHLPYAPSEKNAKRFGAADYSSPSIDAVKTHRMIFRHPERVEVDFEHAGKVEFNDEEIRIVKALYDAEVADVDDRLRKILARMAETGLLDTTIVIISADHGEELFDHGWLGHASTGYDAKLYDELIHVPLLIRLPDKSLTGRFDALVQGVDLMPTIFDFLGVSAEDMQPRMQGRSLLPLMKGEVESIRNYVFNQTTLKGWTTPREEMRRRIVSVRDRHRKLIRIPTAEGTRIEAYDLRRDPGEKSNIYPRRQDEFSDLETALQAWIADNRSRAASLVLGAGEKRIGGIAESILDEVDLGDAVDSWIALQTIEDTWSLEPDVVFEHAPYHEEWNSIQRDAARMIGRAMICASENGILRSNERKTPTEIDAWYCDRR